MESKADLQSYKNLWFSVIYQAIDDATCNDRKHIVDGRDIRAYARHWIFEPNRDFFLVCLLADIAPEYVRYLTKTAIEELTDTDNTIRRKRKKPLETTKRPKTRSDKGKKHKTKKNKPEE